MSGRCRWWCQWRKSHHQSSLPQQQHWFYTTDVNRICKYCINIFQTPVSGERNQIHFNLDTQGQVPTQIRTQWLWRMFLRLFRRSWGWRRWWWVWRSCRTCNWRPGCQSLIPQWPPRHSYQLQTTESSHISLLCYRLIISLNALLLGYEINQFPSMQCLA